MGIKKLLIIIFFIICAAAVGFLYIQYADNLTTYRTPSVTKYSATIDLMEPTSGIITFEAPKSDLSDSLKINAFKEMAGDILEDQYWLVYDPDVDVKSNGNKDVVSFDFIAKSQKEFIWKEATFYCDFNAFYSEVAVKILIPDGYIVDDAVTQNAQKDVVQSYEAGRQVLSTKSKSNERMDILVRYSKI